MATSYDKASVTSGDSTTVYTPTHTTSEQGDDLFPRDSPGPSPSNNNGGGGGGSTEIFSPRGPAAGQTYLIRERATGRVLQVRGGRVRVVEADADPRGGCYWACEESLGWLGFRETVSGGFLGRDGNFGFRAAAQAHLPWEWFVVSPRGTDGCRLQSPHWLSLRWVGLGGRDGRSLVDVTEPEKAVLWEFVEVST
ncbi:putative sis protein [Rosellinia necatrix]|uniref:Putative sis protein n=1 Tax=Rosellinia necatrix TaxID=77044 RepID=A0A1W2TQD9_ROSNE|nr:putative sis protein [Rosellinia necatrix]